MTKPVTFVAVAPDGTTNTKASKSRTYTHARWIAFPGDDHQTIVSWHMTETAAHKSPFQSANWKNFPWGVVPVTPETDAPQQVPAAMPEPAPAPADASVATGAADVATPIETVGAATVAGWFGYNRASVSNWRKNYTNTPTPDVIHDGNPGWLPSRKADWRRWYETDGPGRPSHRKPNHRRVAAATQRPTYTDSVAGFRAAIVQAVSTAESKARAARARSIETIATKGKKTMGLTEVQARHVAAQLDDVFTREGDAVTIDSLYSKGGRLWAVLSGDNGHEGEECPISELWLRPSSDAPGDHDPHPHDAERAASKANTGNEVTK